MVVLLSGRRIFLASPGDLADERAEARRIIDEFNEGAIDQYSVIFVPQGWERVRGAVGRPQELINEELDKSDFLVLMLGGRWGSPPLDDANLYTSGTEEEFYRAAELLADPDAPMRDVLVLFKTMDADRLAEPDQDLKRVLAFRDMLDERKPLMYVPFDTLATLRSSLERSLRDWQLPRHTSKVPRRLDVVRPIPVEEETTVQMSVDELLEDARVKHERGRVTQAELSYARAAESGDARALGQFAQFMRRTGRLQTSLDLARRALDTPALQGDDLQTRELRARSLATVGIVERELGEIGGSIATLQEARRLLDPEGSPNSDALPYVLDNLALSWDRAGDLAKAVELFELAYASRQAPGRKVDASQSVANLAGVLVRQKRFGEALERYDQALGALTDVPGADASRLRAKALAGKAKALLRLERPADAADLLERAIGEDEALGDSRGVAIARGLLAESYLALGQTAAAETHARLVLEDGETSGSLAGQATGCWRLGQVEVQRGNPSVADQYFDRAEVYAERAGNRGLLGAIRATRSDPIPSIGTTQDPAR